MILGSHTITVLRATSTEDAYGNQTPTWPTTGTTVTGCSVQPDTQSLRISEVTVGRQTVVSRWQMYAPIGTDIIATDRVVHDGDTYEVDGEVQTWDHVALPHKFARLRRGENL